MADDVLRIKVDRQVYNDTLNKLQGQLDNLYDYRNTLEENINRLDSGNIFAGADVKVAISKARDALEKVNDAISRVVGYRESIQQQLTGVEQQKAQLEGDMSSIDLPNMFS